MKYQCPICGESVWRDVDEDILDTDIWTNICEPCLDLWFERVEVQAFLLKTEEIISHLPGNS